MNVNPVIYVFIFRDGLVWIIKEVEEVEEGNGEHLVLAIIIINLDIIIVDLLLILIKVEDSVEVIKDLIIILIIQIKVMA